MTLQKRKNQGRLCGHSWTVCLAVSFHEVITTMQSVALQDPRTFEEAYIHYGLKDECLATLAQLTTAYCSEDPDLRSIMLDTARQHVDFCTSPGCLVNVRARAESADSDLERRVYRYIADRFAIGWIRVDGDYQIADSPEGRRIVVRIGPEFASRIPYSTMEIFRPWSGEAGSVVFDVSDEALYRQPERLLQHLDECAAHSAKTYELVSEPLVWQSLLGDGPKGVLVRYQGRTKRIAIDSSLYERYKPLLRFSKAGDTERDLGVELALDQDMGEEVLILRKFAIQYDERSWFAGFLRQALQFLKIDRYRHDQVEQLARAERIDMQPSEECQPGRPQPFLDGFRSTDNPAESELVDTVDRSLLMRRVWTTLSEIERRVLTLRAKDLTDLAISRLVGYERSAVTKIRHRIRRKADRLRE